MRKHILNNQMKDINLIKLKVFESVYLYIETKQDVYKVEALTNLDELMKCYHVKKRKVISIDLKLAFKQFILNSSGYKETLIKLYSSIN